MDFNKGLKDGIPVALGYFSVSIRLRSHGQSKMNAARTGSRPDFRDKPHRQPDSLPA